MKPNQKISVQPVMRRYLVTMDLKSKRVILDVADRFENKDLDKDFRQEYNLEVVSLSDAMSQVANIIYPTSNAFRK